MLKALVISFLLLFGSLVHSKTIKLHEDNTIGINGPIDFSSPLNFAINLARLNSLPTNDPIYLYIFSPGGSVAASEAIIKLSLESRRKVHTVSLRAVSAAFNIVQALGTRYLTERSLFLTHFIYIAPKFELNDHNIRVMTEALPDLNRIYKRCADRMGISQNEYELFMSNEMYVRGENVIKIGAADEIVKISCTKNLILTGICYE